MNWRRRLRRCALGALACLAVLLCSGPARAQFPVAGWGYGYGYPGYGYGMYGMYGVPYGYGLGYGYGYGYGYPGFGWGGYGVPMGGIAYGGFAPGFGYGVYGTGFGYGLGGFGAFTGGFYGLGPIADPYANPMFGVGLSPLGFGSYFTEMNALGRGQLQADVRARMRDAMRAR